MKEYIKLPLTLFVATTISATLITTMHNIAVPILEARTKETLDATFNDMYANNLRDYQVIAEDVELDTPAVYRVNLNDGTVETVFEMVETGKNGPIKMLISYDQDGNISNLKYLEVSETPGIGSKVTEAAFIATIVGQNSSTATIDGISGATISSTAVRTAVENSASLEQGGEYNE